MNWSDRHTKHYAITVFVCVKGGSPHCWVLAVKLEILSPRSLGFPFLSRGSLSRCWSLWGPSGVVFLTCGSGWPWVFRTPGSISLATMACMKALRRDLQLLVAYFTREHPQFQVLDATLDDVSFRFIEASNKHHDIHANFLVSLIVTCTLCLLKSLLIAWNFFAGKLPRDSSCLVFRFWQCENYQCSGNSCRNQWPRQLHFTSGENGRQSL